MPKRVYRLAHVLQAHEATYPDPLELRMGQEVTPGRQDTRWAEYTWCTDASGKGGWVPRSFLESESGICRLRRDYTSRELTVAVGEEVMVGEEAGGWFWAQSLAGDSGWVPAEYLHIDTVPYIETERLILRPFEQTDALEMHQLMSGEGVLRYFPSQEVPPLARVEKMISSILVHWQDMGYGIWAVTGKPTGTLLGRCGLQYLRETEGVEIDFLLGNTFWGRGYATEAAGACLAYGFETLSLEKVDGIVHIDNVASRRVMEKLGMRRVQQATFFGIPCYHYVAYRPSLTD